MVLNNNTRGIVKYEKRGADKRKIRTGDECAQGLPPHERWVWEEKILSNPSSNRRPLWTHCREATSFTPDRPYLAAISLTGSETFSGKCGVDMTTLVHPMVKPLKAEISNGLMSVGK